MLAKIKKQVDLQQKEFGKIFYKKIIPALKKENVFLKNTEELNAEEIAYVNTYYESVKHLFAPINNTAHTFLENEALYLVGQLNDGSLTWVKLSDSTQRFVQIPSSDESSCVVFIDDILKLHLNNEFGCKFYSVKVSRDAELYIDDEYSGNLLEKIQSALPNRNIGQLTRVLIDESMPENLIKAIEKDLDVNETDLIIGGKYHNFKDFFGFPKINNDKFYFKELTPIKKKTYASTKNIFDIIAKKDRLLCFPYESFDNLLRLVEAAANDSSVTQIKMTLYRVSDDSSVAKALLLAAQKGKEVYVFIETKARFDEENNIKWGRILEENGANVSYSYPGIKVHSKILYIERNENETKKSYCYIGTGNFNEKTSRIYTDFGLLTADKRITSELLQVFQVLERKLIVPKTKKIVVSPFSTRRTFEELINNEIIFSEAGKEAGITLKLNSLQDEKLIKLLYKANNTGVKIRLLVRGICCLVPGVKGQSEHISVTSIVDRFLEHGRVYLFKNGGKEKMYIGSADWMTRNLDHRIEVITPIFDNQIRKKMKSILALQLKESVKARIIDANQKNKYVEKKKNGEDSSQHLIYESLL